MLHPRRRRHDGLDPQLVPRGGHDLQGRLGRGHQPVEHPLVSYELLKGGGTASRPGELHARRRRVGRHDQVAAARPAAPPRWSSSTSTTPTSRSSSGARPIEERKARVLRDAGFDMDLDGDDSHSIQYQNANNSVRVTDEFMQAVDRRRRLAPAGRHRPARSMQHRAGPRPRAPDRRGGVGVRRPRHAVRHHDQPLAHRAEHRPHQRLATRAASTCTSTTRRATSLASTCCKYLDDDDSFDVDGFRHTVEVDVHRAGDPRRQRRLPDREDRRDQPRRSASSASATPTSARC